MKKIVRTGQFKKDYKKLVRQGKDIRELKAIVTKLSKGEKLPPQNKDHKLTGRLGKYRDCHIQSDWILIYQINKKEQELILVRMGSHSELFK